MSLVTYDFSDNEEDDEQVPTTEEAKSVIGQTNQPTTSSKPQAESNPKTSQSTFSSTLPSVSVKRSKTGKIQIAAPSFSLDLAESEEEDEEEEERRKIRRLQKSINGSELISILPKPKNSFAPAAAAATKSVTSLIPNSLINRFKVQDAVTKPSTSKSEVSVSNYSFGEDEESSDEDGPSITPQFDQWAPSTSSGVTAASESFAFVGPAKPPVKDADDEAVYLDPNEDVTYKKYIASKFGEESTENIKFVDIDIGKQVSENKEWLKNISQEKPVDEENIKGPAPTSAARRKHQITYLAFEAQKREVELKNQWAANRATRTQSKAKYGF